jgi:excisionase family DNA binding protein
MMTADLEVLNTSEGAKLLRMSPQKLRELADAGKLPAFHVGNRWRFRRQDLIDWVESQAQANLTTQASDSDSLSL